MSDGAFRFDVQADERRAQLPAADTRDPPDPLEVFLAGRRTKEDDELVTQTSRLFDAYRPLVRALLEKGVDERSLLVGGRPAPAEGYGYDNARVWREAAARGLVTGKREDFEREALNRGAGRADDLELLSRSRGLPSWFAGAAGDMIGGPQSIAENVMSMPIGGAGKSVIAKIATEGLANAGITALTLPEQFAGRARLGEEMTTGEAVGQVASSFALGALTRGGIETGKVVLPAVDRAGYRALTPVRQAFDRAFTNSDIERSLRQVPEFARTPQQRAWLDIMVRDREIDAGSPYVRTAEGDAAHRARLGEAMDQLHPDAPPRAAPVNHERLKARIRGPESHGNDNATNALGSSASGRYQFVKETFIGLYSRVYRVNRAIAERVWNSRRRFDGDVQEALMDRLIAENTKALRDAGIQVDDGNLYVMHVLGLRDGLRALRADPNARIADILGGEIVAKNPTYFGGGRSVADALAKVRSMVGGGPDAGPHARTGESADPTDGLGDALDAERADIEAARQRAEDEARQLPDLRRELFDSDAAWREAQMRADAETLGIEPPAPLDHAEFDPVEIVRNFTRTSKANLNRTAELAAELGLDETEVRTALEALVADGTITTRKGSFIRKPKPPPPPPSRDLSLLEFIGNQGGIADTGGDLKAMGAGEWHKETKPGKKGKKVRVDSRRKPLIRSMQAGEQEGMFGTDTGQGQKFGLDSMFDAAISAGYFPELAGARERYEDLPDTNIFLHAIAAELRGKPRYAVDAKTKGDFAPDEPRVGDDERYPGELDDYRQERLREVLQEKFGLWLEQDDIDAFHDLMNRGTQRLPPEPKIENLTDDDIAPYANEFINRKFEDALDDGRAESGDDGYDIEFYERYDTGEEDRAIDPSDPGPTPEPGDAGEGGAGAGPGGEVPPVAGAGGPTGGTGGEPPAGEPGGRIEQADPRPRGPVTQMPGKRTNKEYRMQGDNARDAGWSEADNPYLETSTAWENWAKGWRERNAMPGTPPLPEPRSPLDLGAQVDPNAAARQRQELDIQAQQPLEGARATGTAQEATLPEGLFGGPEEPGMFDGGLDRMDDPDGVAIQQEAEGLAHDVRAALDAGEFEGRQFGTGAGGAPEDVASLLARLDDEDAALKAVRDCL